MNIATAIKVKDNLTATIRLLKFFVVVIGFAVIYMAYKVDHAVEYRRETLVPVFFDEKLEVSGNDVSDETAELYASRAVLLRANYSPGTARKNFNRLLRLYAPSSYPDAWKQLYDLADRIETANVSSTYYPDKLETDRKSKWIMVEGRNRKFKDNSSLIDMTVQYVINYKVDHGMFQILDIEEKEKK